MSDTSPSSREVVVALDSFKGSLSAEEACRIVQETLREARPSLHVVCRPMADGGEGTVRALLAARKGEWIVQRVMGPWPGRIVEAGYAWFAEDQLAVVETASAAGLTLLAPSERQPLRTTTCGVGELIRAAADRGAARIWLAVGGSATVDGGVGAATALGWAFLDAEGRPLPLGGGALARLAAIRPPKPLRLPPLEVLYDATHRLCGPEGAARVFGPQKGATPEQVSQLEAGLERLAEIVRRDIGGDLRSVIGGGAAGGLAAGAVAFMNARLRPGVEAVMQAVNLAGALHGADWVITGEGRLDETSLRGKVVSGVIAAARQAGARVAILAGTVRLSPEALRAAGIESALACAEAGVPSEQAMAEARERLADATRKWIADTA